MKNRLARLSTLAATISAAFVALDFQSAAQAQQVEELRAKLPEEIRKSGVIKIGVPRTIPPHVFLEGDRLVGVGVDLTKEMEPILGVKFQYLDMQWPGIIPGLQGGSIDLSIGIISYKKEREAFLNMIPYVQDANAVMTAPDMTEITADPLSLCGHTVGVVQASNYVPMVEGESKRCVSRGKGAIRVSQFGSNSAVLAGFQSRSIDAWVHTAVELAAVSKTLHGTKIYVLSDPEWQAMPDVMATSKDQEGLAQALLGALQIIINDGRYKAILAKYGDQAGELDKSKIVLNP